MEIDTTQTQKGVSYSKNHKQLKIVKYYLILKMSRVHKHGK